MKLRNSLHYRTFTGLTALLVSAGGAARAEPTLRMRPGPRRLAQAVPLAQKTPAAPPQTGQGPPQTGQAPPDAPPPSPDAPPLPPPSPDAAPDATTPAPDATTPAPDAGPAATAAASPTTAPAPEQPSVPGDEAPPGAGEVIVVTGSRIGDPLGKQAPVLMMSREDIERTGLTSVGDILQQLPVSGGAINGKYNSSGNFGYPPD